LARDEDQEINLEWTAVNRAVGSLPQAVRFLELADQPNATLAVDLLHLTRSGGRPEEVAALPPRLARYAQISDGPLHRTLEEYGAVELVVERLPPGDGEFPTAAFVAALPPDVVVEVEAPQSRARDAGVSPFERARRSVEGARRFLS